MYYFGDCRWGWFVVFYSLVWFLDLDLAGGGEYLAGSILTYVRDELYVFVIYVV